MARPRKDALDAHVEKRIEEAFWALSEDAPIEHISVVALSQKAHCNRGTFYYYYRDIYDLIDKIIDESMPESVFAPLLAGMSTQDYESTLRDTIDTGSEDLRRLGMLIRRSSSNYAADSMTDHALILYAATLGKAPEELSESDRIWCEFLSNGMIGVLKHLAIEGTVRGSDMIGAFYPEVSQAIVARTKRRISEGALSEEDIRRAARSRLNETTRKKGRAHRSEA